LSDNTPSDLGVERTAGHSNRPWFAVGPEAEGHQLPEERYCSCLFKYGRGRKTPPKPGAYNKYAVCSSSVFVKQGKRGPGSVSCRYTKGYLDNFDEADFENYFQYDPPAQRWLAASLSASSSPSLSSSFTDKVKIEKEQLSPLSQEKKSSKKWRTLLDEYLDDKGFHGGTPKSISMEDYQRWKKSLLQ
jgi:hypothetical protein